MPNLPPGLYDQLVNQLLAGNLQHLPAHHLHAVIKTVEPAEIPNRAAALLASHIQQTLASAPEEERNALALQLSTEILTAIQRLQPETEQTQARLLDPIQRLAAIEPLTPGGKPESIRQPITPLRDTVLMTNARDQPAVGREIEAEIASADRIDIVLAFIRWTGIRSLLPHLRLHAERKRELRILTTTYTGSTEARALDALQALGATVKVSYDTSGTRLHAKAWLFYRQTGFSTAYIGSSNLTHSAQVTGLEWNVRASQRLNPDLIAAFERTFSTYWADPHFEPYHPARFARATALDRVDNSIHTPFSIEPYPFQRQILDRLRLQRDNGTQNNLVVAATGTGKTIIAALDYRCLQASLPRSRLLFVAHRNEILQQSRATFRHVLRQGSFGQLWSGGNIPSDWEHVFASIQSLSRNQTDMIDPDQFDVVIVDEFHHAAANTYTALLDHLRPHHLIGLTATPERSDGLDILKWFDGQIAVELRLWDALEQGLLAPFHYFGIHDATDLSGVNWRSGSGYDITQLNNVYTANDFWISKVIAATVEKIGNPKRMRALAFCVSIEHASFVAAKFQQSGIEALAVTSTTSTTIRQQALLDIESGKLQLLAAVDLFNEGVDIPAIDVVLMLRPTESATIFLQQLGRGLRKSAQKDVLTVLDFVGYQHKAFRFDQRYRRMLGRSRRQLVADIQQQFPYLPAGCQIELDPVSREIILSNVKNALPNTWKQRVQELRELGDVTLQTFLNETTLELDDIYRGNHSWTQMRRAAGFDTTAAIAGEDKLARGVARLLHIDDQQRIKSYIALLRSPQAPDAATLANRQRRQLQGLLLTVLNPAKNSFANLQSAAQYLWRFHQIRHEILEVLEQLKNQVTHLHQPLSDHHPIPLQVHAQYNREEILAAFGASTVDKPMPLQSGVYWHQATRTDLLFVTLQKTEKDYSPTTRYLDYAISDQLFHWESQARDTVASERGQNYIHHRTRNRTVTLFVRLAKKDPGTGRTMAYFCAGNAHYVEHRSERPIQITWRLDQPLPGDVFANYRAAVA